MKIYCVKKRNRLRKCVRFFYEKKRDYKPRSFFAKNKSFSEFNIFHTALPEKETNSKILGFTSGYF